MSNATAIPRTLRVAALTAMVITALTATLGAAPVRAGSSVEMQLRPLLGGRYEVGGWAAIAVTLVNDGEPTEGNLTAETDGGTVLRFVEMPAGSRKVVMLYVQPEAFQRRVTVRYQEPNGTLEAEAEVRAFEQAGTQIAIVGDGTGVLGAHVNAAIDESGSQPISIAPGDIPERPEPLDGISSLVWAADSSSLTESQRLSITSWVARGGQLIVVGGADWQARTAAFGDVLPLTGVTSLDGLAQASLAEWTGAAGTPPSATVASGEPTEEARTLVTADDGTVLLSMRPVGAGRVIFIGADVASEPFRAWDGGARLWGRLLPSTLDLQEFFGGFPVEQEAMNSMNQALGNLPSLDVPPAELLLGVIVGYILLIGPLSYVVLRRVDRREAAWITAPLLVVLFTACSYGIGNAMKGTDLVVNQIALIRSSEVGGAALVESYAGIFSPQRASYDVRVDADALVAPVPTISFDGRPSRGDEVSVEQGNPARLRDLAVGVFGFKAVRADTVVDYEPSLTVSWRQEDDDIVGTVTNVGDSPITDVAYVSTSAGELIGDLAPGASADFEPPGPNFNGSPASDQVYGFGGFDPSADAAERAVATRRQVIDALVGYAHFMPGVDLGDTNRGPFIIGWRDGDGPVPVIVEDLTAQRYAQSVEIISVSPPLPTGEVRIPPAEMSVTIATEGDASSAGPGMISVGDGSATFAITLPLEAADMEVTELEIIIGPDPMMVLGDQGGFMGPGFWPPGLVAEIRDQRTGDWELLGELSQESSFEIDDPGRMVATGGRIEVRVSGDEAIDPNFGMPGVFVGAEVRGVIGE